MRRAAALLAAVCVLGGATALAAARLFGMNVNGRELPPLEPMTMVETADTGGPADGTEQQAEGLGRAFPGFGRAGSSGRRAPGKIRIRA